jgi:hypothetical protein
MVHIGITILGVIPIVLIGIVLGFHSSRFILVPIMVGVSGIIALAMAHTDNLWSILLTIGLAVMTLQIGYAFGAANSIIVAVISTCKIYTQCTEPVDETKGCGKYGHRGPY